VPHQPCASRQTGAKVVQGRYAFPGTDIDAGRDFTETYLELDIAEELLAADSIITVDASKIRSWGGR
jgi:hypothetical protein